MIIEGKYLRYWPAENCQNWSALIAIKRVAFTR